MSNEIMDVKHVGRCLLMDLLVKYQLSLLLSEGASAFYSSLVKESKITEPQLWLKCFPSVLIQARVGHSCCLAHESVL